MNGSIRKKTEREAILDALKRAPPEGYYVWDGVEEDDRPATDEELRSGLAAARRARGRPSGSAKESTTIRFDRDVLEAFRAAGPGWQSRMNAALRDWLKTHSPS